MRRYVCPVCGEKELVYTDRNSKCINCGGIIDTRGFSKLDMHHKKHLPRLELVTPDGDLLKNKPKLEKTTQRFEKIVSRALKNLPDTWYMKIQVNPMARHPTLADYLILTNKYNIALECKELDTTKNNIIPFARFTQLKRLIEFENSLKKNLAFVGISLFGLHETYIIPAKTLHDYIKSSEKKSLNIKELQSVFKEYKLPYQEYYTTAYKHIELYAKENWA